MKVTHIILSAALAIAAAMSSCKSHTQEHALVSLQGIDDAQTLIDNYQAWNELQIQTFLLQVRSTQQEYARRYDERAAMAYESSFEDHIRANSDSLAAMILF